MFFSLTLDVNPLSLQLKCFWTVVAFPNLTLDVHTNTPEICKHVEPADFSVPHSQTETLMVGAHVTVSGNYANFGDAGSGPLAPGKCGIIIKQDTRNIPFLVRIVKRTTEQAKKQKQKQKHVKIGSLCWPIADLYCLCRWHHISFGWS